MGVYIKGMKMPEKTYAYCMLIKDIDGSVQLHVCTKNSEEMSEWELFNLVPVPPHGRLIDADALLKINNPIGKMMVFGGEYVYSQSEIENAPTILEAEEKEWQR